MLGKMMIQGLVAAVLVSGAASVYAQAGDRDAPAAAPADTGYLRQGDDAIRGDRDSREHADRVGRRHGDRDRHEGRERHRHRDRHGDD